MKVVVSEIATTYSGRLGNIVFKIGNFVPIAGLESRAKIVRYSDPTANTIKQLNSRAAFKLMSASYQLLRDNPEQYQTWIDQAQAYTVQYEYTISAWMIYSGFYMAKFYGTFSSWVLPTALIAADSVFWEDRNQAYWI